MCEGTCTFTYTDTGASTVTVPASTIYRAGDNITVDGTGLTGAVVTVGGVVATIVSNNDTQVVFTYPALVAG